MQPVPPLNLTTFNRSKCGKFGDAVIIGILLVIGGLLEFNIIPVHMQQISDSPIYSKPNTTATISDTALMLFVIIPWYLLFILNFALFYFCDTSFSYMKWLKHFYLMNRMMILSFSIALIVTDLLKSVIGAPRPYFLTVERDVEDGLIDESELIQARLSFVSGHASESMSSLFLLSMMMYSAYKYTQNVYYNQVGRVTMTSCDNAHDYYLSWFWYQLREIPLLSMIIIAIPTIVAIYIGSTRITDYKHFKVDVVGGMLLGILCAVTSYSMFWNETYFVIESALKMKCDQLHFVENDDHPIGSDADTV